MGINYLNRSDHYSWNDITREERLFCSHLYHSILLLRDKRKFIENLNKIPSPRKEFQNKLNLSPEKDWEVGFEVCFYRDLLFHHGFSIGDVNKEKKEEEEEEEGVHFSEKRTFDLCLFADDELVIIEAKAYQGLTSKQNKEFEEDKNQIKNLYNFLRGSKSDFQLTKAPQVKLVILASSHYFDSPSFERDDGIGKNLINDNCSEENLCGLISWRDISDRLFPCDPIFKRADIIYNAKPKK